MASHEPDIQLKFDGDTVRRLDGAPADAVVACLTALQRMVYIIGMRAEGRRLSERLKPTAKVKREYAVVCKAPEEGSHVQPIAVTSRAGAETAAAQAARTKLLAALRAFDSGDDAKVAAALPSQRERWFMAHAALGLLPAEDSGLEIGVRVGERGPFTFKATRARQLLNRYAKASPPDAAEDEIAGKIRAIDFTSTVLTVKPGSEPALRFDYPLPLEEWLMKNVRKRVLLSGKPSINQKGDITSFEELRTVVELEPTLEPISEFASGGTTIIAPRALSIPVTVIWQERLFTFEDVDLGIYAYTASYSELRTSILAELDVLWRQYAEADPRELDDEAKAVRSALLTRFRKVKT